MKTDVKVVRGTTNTFKITVTDVGIQSGDDLYNVIPASAFCVCKNIVKWGCVNPIQ